MTDLGYAKQVISWEAIDPDPETWGGDRREAWNAIEAAQRVIDAARHFVIQENPAWNGYRQFAEKSLREAVEAFDAEG